VGENAELVVTCECLGWTLHARPLDAEVNTKSAFAHSSRSMRAQMTSLSAKLWGTGLALALSVAPLGAFEIFGLKFFEDKEPERVELISPLFYNLEWAVESEDVDLRNLIGRSSTLIRDQAQPASGRAGLLSAAKGDYQRLVETLYARGYYAGSVSIIAWN